jgi:septum formation topological specificity factor MinE
MSEYRLELLIAEKIAKNQDETFAKMAHEIVEDLKRRIRVEPELLEALSRP